MKNKRVILWFRSDLRLHDNEALIDAIEVGSEVIPVYVFDERVFKGKTNYGFKKTDVFRAQFIKESVEELKENLQNLGSDLIVRIGKPEEVVFELAKELKTSWVFCNRERTDEELKVQDSLESNLWSIGQEVRFSRGKMLYYTSDLPFPVTHTPDIFTIFRKEVERIVEVRDPLANPEEINTPIEGIDFGEIPHLKEFGFSDDDLERLSGAILKGGEKEGLKRLNYFFWEMEGIQNYKNTKNELLGLDGSSKFSAYLSSGCLSPKKIYNELMRYENERKKNDSTYHMFYELLWRDFFRLMGKKHGNPIFKRGGIKREVNVDLKDDSSLFRIWSDARTGIPFIDAAMRELNRTGFLSNRARLNIASFLVNDLKVNWQMGAEYFESMLIDYDPCSNWGNWNYLAGLGNDPKENKYFNIILQARRYDPQGSYVKHWIPELANVTTEFIHQPHLMSDEEQKKVGVVLAKNYPNPCIKLEDT